MSKITESLAKAHATLLASLSGITPDHAESEHSVNEKWNLKQLLSHLAAHEHLLEDALGHSLSSGATVPYIRQYRSMTPEEFSQNNIEVRKDLHYEDILSELNSSYEHVIKSLRLFTPQMLNRRDMVPWYEKDKSLAEYIADVCRHKLDHAEQINKFKDYLDKISHIPTKK